MWRKLRALGAVPLRKSVYLLPPTPDNFERFQWLSQEVQKDGGEATFLSVENVENMKRAEVIRLFQQVRDQDYRALVERYRKLARGLDRKTPVRSTSRRNEELTRLARELERIREIDFFDAPGYHEAKRLQETIEMRLHPGQADAPAADLPMDALKGRRWVTRPRPHVDRIGSAWLIKRFIDPDADFVFAPSKDFPPDAIPFDSAGVEFGHQGEDCTFETLVKRLGQRDRRLTHLAEIVHEVDLKDQKFPRDEARGVDLAIRGLLATFKDDQEVLTHGMVLFDGLYTALSDRP
ncbi:MAG TPA: chromate resistance protein ChrB domain-containing protein [Gemmatimonadales bacterium]|nr:chromate resistance protein ChrB domain-containing protein [Gemmatimonadales bacterium]